MDLRSVRAFVAVVDAGTVTGAAARLGIGQPAVTRQVQQLERDLRVPLFAREEGRLRLTAGGEAVLVAARALLHQAQEVAATAGEVAAGRLHRVRVATTGTTRDDVVAPWLATWGPQAPLPAIVEAGVDGLYPALAQGADLAVSPTAPPARLASRHVADLPLWACVPEGHPWAGRDDVALAELAGADLLLLSRAFHARRALDVALDREGLGVEPLAEFTSPVVVQAVAASGRGVAVLTDDPRFGLAPLAIRDATGRRLEISLHAAWDREHHAAAALADLAVDLQAFVAERYA